MLKLTKKMNNKTKNSIIILSIVVILISAFITYFKLNLNKDIEYIIETKKNNFLASEKIQSVSGLKNKTAEIEKAHNYFNSLYIDRANVLNFIEAIEKTGNNNGLILTIENVNVDETHLKEALPYGLLNMTLTATGKLDSITKFLADLEKLPHALDFKTVRLISAEGENSSGWSVNVVLNGITN